MNGGSWEKNREVWEKNGVCGERVGGRQGAARRAEAATRRTALQGSLGGRHGGWAYRG